MCVALIGGMDRLERDYININEAERLGVELKVYTKSENRHCIKDQACGCSGYFYKQGIAQDKKGGDEYSKSKKYSGFSASFMRYLHTQKLPKLSE